MKRAWPSWMVTAAVAALGIMMGSLASAAEPQGESVGIFDPSHGMFYLRDDAGNTTRFHYGNPGDLALMGDWDCDGVDTPGVYRPSNSTIYLRNSNSIGSADWWYMFGNPGDVPVAGDFDGDGCDSVWLYRPSEQRLYVTDRQKAPSNEMGAAELTYDIGNEGDQPVAGDLDGDGADEIALYRPSEGRVYYWLGTPEGIADGYWTFGYPFDQLLIGDWAPQGLETLGTFRPLEGRFILSAANGDPGSPDEIIEYGGPGLAAVSGRFGPLPGGDKSPRVKDSFALTAVVDPPLSYASGEGCLVPSAGSDVEIVFDDATGTRFSATIPVMSDGTWSGEFLVPFTVPRGDYQVSARCRSNGQARLTYLARDWEPNEHWSVSACSPEVWEGGPWWLGPVIGQWMVDHWAADHDPYSTSIVWGFRQGGWIMAMGGPGLWTWTPDSQLIPTFVLRTEEEVKSFMVDRPSAEEFLSILRTAVPDLPSELATCQVASGQYSDLP